jgi:hypothetical protein
MEENQGKETVKKINLKKALPFIIFFILLFFLIISSNVTHHPPVIVSITPQVAEPGDELIILGNFFSSDRNGGRIEVSGYSPPSSIYKWSDKKISFIVPEDMPGGLIRVITKDGISSETVLFTNKMFIPVFATALIEPGKPYIFECTPEQGAVGTEITIGGINFGQERGNSRVYFSWISGIQEQSIQVTGISDMVPASEFDFDYVVWSEKKIVVKIPDGASSGNIKIVTDKGVSNNVYLEVLDKVGKKLYDNKRIYHIQNTIEIKDINAEEGNGLYLWIPCLIGIPEQREIQEIELVPEPMFRDYKGLNLILMEDIKKNHTYTIRQSYMCSRLEIETHINESNIPPYNEETRIYKKYVSATSDIPADSENVVDLASSIVTGIQNSYAKARAIYDYVRDTLSFSQKNTIINNIVDITEITAGDSYTYALLYCSLCRSIGIPSRIIAGYIIDFKNICSNHYWVEFYIEDFGWIPVDPVLGDGKRYGSFPDVDNPDKYYFGSLDNRHITLSKGTVILKQMNPESFTIRRNDVVSLQTIHEEYFGNIYSYNVKWNDFEIVGIY